MNAEKLSNSYSMGKIRLRPTHSLKTKTEFYLRPINYTRAGCLRSVHRICAAPWSCTSLVTCILVFISPPSETGHLKKKMKLKAQVNGTNHVISPRREEKEGRMPLTVPCLVRGQVHSTLCHREMVQHEKKKRSIQGDLRLSSRWMTLVKLHNLFCFSSIKYNRDNYIQLMGLL